jgi:hypothetical protein
MPDFITLHVLNGRPFGVKIDHFRRKRLSGVELDVIVQRDALSAAIGDELFLQVEAGMVVELDLIPAIAESVYITSSSLRSARLAKTKRSKGKFLTFPALAGRLRISGTDNWKHGQRLWRCDSGAGQKVPSA